VFRALAENTSSSGPSDTAVIPQDTTELASGAKLTVMTFGAATVKCPFFEDKVAETLLSLLFAVAISTMFWIVAVTVAVCPVTRLTGIWFAVMLSVWLYPWEPWQLLQGLVDVANVGARSSRATTTANAVSKRNDALCVLIVLVRGLFFVSFIFSIQVYVGLLFLWNFEKQSKRFL
jgi:hypothetical protein